MFSVFSILESIASAPYEHDNLRSSINLMKAVDETQVASIWLQNGVGVVGAECTLSVMKMDAKKSFRTAAESF